MSTPIKPEFPMHQVYLNIVRRRSVYRPGVRAEEIQRHIQKLIRGMTENGYRRMWCGQCFISRPIPRSARPRNTDAIFLAHGRVAFGKGIHAGVQES